MSYSQDNMMGLAKRLFPICRSIMGEGVRETLSVLKEICPELHIHEVKTGTKVLDWTVPREWNISEAYVENSEGKRIIDFADNNLHVVGYSVPVDTKISLDSLKEHLYIQENQPDVIPYVTSYYRENWGFCLSQNQYNELQDDEYHVVIKSELSEGKLNYGEIIIPGKENKEIFISTYLCHPSMANDNLSSVCVAIFVAKWLLTQKNMRYTYRIVFAPETIGAIAYIDRNLKQLKDNVISAFCLSCMGDDKMYSYIPSRNGNTLSDRLVLNNLKFSEKKYELYSFLDRGSDERQYCAPGVDLPMCGLCKSKYHVFPEYHTSADNLDFISEKGMQQSYEWILELIRTLEGNKTYLVTCLGEPQLGKRNLYPTTSQKFTYGDSRTIQNFLAYADGINDLIEIGEKIHCAASKLLEIAELLVSAELLEVKGE